MLDTMRRGANTFVAKFLLGLLTLSFIGWGVGSRLGNLHSDTLATVGGTKISLGEFQMAYQRQSQTFSRQLGQPLTPDMARAFGLPQQVLGGLMASATVEELANSLGLGISDARLANQIADDPNLRPPGATSFDRTYFTRLLQQNGMSEAMYVRQHKSKALESQLADGLSGGITAPKAMVAAIYRYRNETRSIEYLTLARAQVDPIAAPSEEVLGKWYEEHKATFKAPEFRTIDYVEVTPAGLADPATVSDTEVQKEYERTKAQYTQPEQRRIQQILYPDEATAKAAVDKLKAGGKFDDLIADRGLKPEDVDLGLIPRAKVADPKVADAAFAAALNVPSDLVASAFGPVLLRVTEIVPEKGKTLAEATPEIRTAVAQKLAEHAVSGMRDEIEDALAGGSTLKEVATRFKLKLSTVEIDAEGNGVDGEPLAGLPTADKFLKSVFAADEGGQNDALQDGHGLLWYEIAKVAPGRDRTLDEVRDKARAAWTDEEAQNRLKAKADEIAAALKAGKPIAELAAAASVEVETADVTRQSTDAGLGSEGLKAAFSGPEGTTASVGGPDGTRLVVRVAKVTAEPMADGAGESVDIADQLSGALRNSLLDQFVAAVEEDYGTTINQSMLNAVVGAGSN
jgi:peptidyl-prolyl cis-trans isomerase D